MTDRRPILVGVSLALASAAAFGVTIPFVGWAGAGVGPFATASLLYLGACVAALVQKAIYSDPGTGLSKRATPTLLIVVLAGAAAAPT